MARLALISLIAVLNGTNDVLSYLPKHIATSSVSFTYRPTTGVYHYEFYSSIASWGERSNLKNTAIFSANPSHDDHRGNHINRPRVDSLLLQNPMKVVKPTAENPTNKFQRGRKPNLNDTNESSDGVIVQLRNPMKVGRAEQRDWSPNQARNGATATRSADRGEASRGPPRKSFSGGAAGAAGSAVEESVDRGPRRAGPPSSTKKKTKIRPEKAETKRGTERQSLRMKNSGGRNNQSMKARGSLKKRDRTGEKARKEEAAFERRRVDIPEGTITVGQLAEILDEKPAIVVKYLMTDLGVMASVSQSLDRDTSVAVAEGFGRIVIGSDDDWESDDEYDEYSDDEETAIELGFALEQENPEDLVPRAPVVTIMGHVDHGKTSLLDSIRNTRVTAGEAGGITQHIGAYQVEHQGQKITFIDTPGHAAFSDMRSRGANITDIVVLVVAADDGVKQQTADSISCAKIAGVPLVVAINKCDLPTADPTRVKADLTAYGVLTEDMGGDTLVSEISAKQGTGLDDLLSKIMLQADLEDLKANPSRDAQGAVVEARMERGLGSVATTLIQKGTIKIGDSFVAGETYGRVRTLISTDGKTRLEEAGPSTPVQIVGFADGVPAAGDVLMVVEDEQIARELAENRKRIAREKSSASYQSGLMDSVQSIFSGQQKQQRQMCVIVKADVQGSAEALARALSELKLENDEVLVKVNVVVADVGEVTKTDVSIATVTPGTTIIAFNTASTFAAMEDARQLNIPIEYYSIVYDAIESVENRMQEVLSPTPEGEYVGSALIQEVFNIGGTGNIAGSKCRDGFIKKGSNVRVMRGDKILCESRVKSLRNFKSNVDTITEGDECGIGLVDFEDFEPGDIIESYVEK